MSKKVILACAECGSRNYTTMSKKRIGTIGVEKILRNMPSHTIHRETK